MLTVLLHYSCLRPEAHNYYISADKWIIDLNELLILCPHLLRKETGGGGGRGANKSTVNFSTQERAGAFARV